MNNEHNPEFCEECHWFDAMVIDSRMTSNGRRRRYQCRNTECNYRWSTYECHSACTTDPILKTLEVLAEKVNLITKHSTQANSVLASVRQTMSRR